MAVSSRCCKLLLTFRYDRGHKKEEHGRKMLHRGAFIYNFYQDERQREKEVVRCGVRSLAHRPVHSSEHSSHQVSGLLGAAPFPGLYWYLAGGHAGWCFARRACRFFHEYSEELLGDFFAVLRRY